MECTGETSFFKLIPARRFNQAVGIALSSSSKPIRPGAHDGFQRMWIDGVFKGEVLNMRWRDTTDVRINALQLTFSGAVAVTKRLWIDNVVVSTQKIGCMTDTPPTEPTGLVVR